ncbi:pilus assembly protein CpaE [Marmoricola sp. OAE513]|uniref:AAA family ATPase n=1 Tax=Marmoricola sp. OAE513 TaxID=2817894 RepID=UPI001AE19C28
MPVLVEPDSSWASALAPALPLGTQVVADASQLDAWLTEQGNEYVALLGPSTDLDTALAIGATLRATHPALGVVLLRTDPTSDVFQSAMQVGASAVARADDLDQITAAVDRSRSTWEAIRGPVGDGGSRDGKVITVFSPKGGVGKTTVSVNLALALSNRGAKVCLVDLDLGFGDVAITLQVIPDHTIAEAIDAEEHLDFSLLDTLLTRHDGLSILAAPTHPDAKERISPALILRVLRILREQFDYVVLDTSPSFDEYVLHAFEETDECVLIATLDVPTVKNVKVAIETLDNLGLVPSHRHLLLNRADDEVGLAPSVVEGLLKMKISTSLPTALAVASATNNGRPIVVGNPDHPVSKALLGLAAELHGAGSRTSAQHNGAGPVEPAKRSVFSRLRK